MADFTQITYDVADSIATLTLSRPEKLNAFTVTMMREMVAAFDMADADDSVRAVVVTGEGRNIGQAMALTLAEGGASVLVNARSNRAEAEAVAREVEAAGGKAIVHIGDVADTKSVQAMADAAVRQLGRIDILVNNAALRREKSFAEMDYAEWREILDVTLDGAFHCTKACLPSLRKSGQGTVVNIGGLSAHTGAKNRAHVVTAKAGIVGFTRALANDLAADGKPEDVAAMVRFLCSPAARYITGQAIHANGGAFMSS